MGRFQTQVVWALPGLQFCILARKREIGTAGSHPINPDQFCFAQDTCECSKLKIKENVIMADLQYERFVCGSKTFPDFWGDFKRNPNVILRSFLHFLGNCRSAEDQQVSSPYYTWRQSWKERWKCPLCECNVFCNSLAHKGEPVRVLRLSVWGPPWSYLNTIYRDVWL